MPVIDCTLLAKITKFIELGLMYIFSNISSSLEFSKVLELWPWREFVVYGIVQHFHSGKYLSVVHYTTMMMQLLSFVNIVFYSQNIQACKYKRVLGSNVLLQEALFRSRKNLRVLMPRLDFKSTRHFIGLITHKFVSEHSKPYF